MISPVGVAQATNVGAATSAAITRTAGKAGNLLFVWFMANDRVNAGTISDTQNNTWIPANADFNDATNNVRMRSWYAFAKNSSSTIITCTTGGGAGGFCTITCSEFENVGALDQTGVGAVGISGTPTSPAIVPNFDSELVIAMSSDTIVLPIGNIDGSAATKGSDDGNGDWTEYRILSGRNGVSMIATFTGSGAYNIFIASFSPKVHTASVPLRPNHFAPGLAR